MINSMIASYPLNELLFIAQFFQEILFPQVWKKVVSSLAQEMSPRTLCLAQGAGLL